MPPFCWRLAVTRQCVDGSPSLRGCRSLAPTVRVARRAERAVVRFPARARAQVGAQAQHCAPEMLGAGCVLAAARRALADHHAVLLDTARSTLTAMRALACAAEGPGICSSLTVAQTDGHDRHQERAQRKPTRHANCLCSALPWREPRPTLAHVIRLSSSRSRQEVSAGASDRWRRG